MMDPSSARAILARSQRAKSNITGPQATATLSPKQQVAKYTKMAGDTAWASRLLESESDPAAVYWLGMIAQYGIKGLADYVAAMQKLQSGPGG